MSDLEEDVHQYNPNRWEFRRTRDLLADAVQGQTFIKREDGKKILFIGITAHSNPEDRQYQFARYKPKSRGPLKPIEIFWSDPASPARKNKLQYWDLKETIEPGSRFYNAFDALLQSAIEKGSK